MCLRCSVATQANFSSSALIAYMWNEITSHSVGGFWRHSLFFSTFSLPWSLSLSLFPATFLSPISPVTLPFSTNPRSPKSHPRIPFFFPASFCINILAGTSSDTTYLALQASSLPRMTPLKQPSRLLLMHSMVPSKWPLRWSVRSLRTGCGAERRIGRGPELLLRGDEGIHPRHGGLI